jgi:CBS domain-containing protein
MKLSDVIACVRSAGIPTTELVTAKPDDPLSAIASLMKQHNVGTVVIVEAGKPVGIVTDRDLALALGAQVPPPQSPVRGIPDGAGVFAATQCIRDAGVRRLPIVDAAGRLTGIVSLDDLLGLLGRELLNLVEGVGRELKIGTQDPRGRIQWTAKDPVC